MAGAKRAAAPGELAPSTDRRDSSTFARRNPERRHIAEAFTFELSKCARRKIRTRMVAGLGVRKVDEGCAAMVSEGLGLRELHAPDEPARQAAHGLPASPALSTWPRARELHGTASSAVLVANGAERGNRRSLRRGRRVGRGPPWSHRPRPFGGVDISDGTRCGRTAGRRRASVLYDAS